MSKRRTPNDSTPEELPRHNPFAALSGLRGALPPGPAAADDPPATSPDPLAAKLVLSRERKGRGGKTVTLLKGVALQGEALADFARQMRQGLGTGGGVEGDVIVIAGDQLDRAAAWLAGRGARRVVIGN